MKKHLMLQISQIGHASQSMWSRKECGQDELEVQTWKSKWDDVWPSHVSLRKTLPILTSRTTADVVLMVRPGHEVWRERLWGKASRRKRSTCSGGDLGYCRCSGYLSYRYRAEGVEQVCKLGERRTC